MKWLLIGLMLWAPCGFTQARSGRKTAPPAPASKWPVQKLVVEGNREFTSEQILAVAGLKIGQMAGKPEFEAARDRLVASGAFESVGYRFEPAPGGAGYVATFQVAEAEPVYPVQFQELGVPDKDLEALLHSRDPLFSMAKAAPTRIVIDRYLAWIREYLEAKGIREKIAGQVTSIGPEQFAIVFRPARNRPAVAQISFEGDQVIPQNVLRSAVSGVAIGSEYTEEHFREVIGNALRPLYEARGRVRVSFPKIRTEPAGDVEGLHVFVTVDEGESYTLGKIGVEGPSPIRPEDLLKTADVKTGDVANFDRVNEGLERMRKALRRAGYMHAKLTTTRNIDDARKNVDVAVHVDPGPQYTMGKLTVAGLDLDGEAEIQRVWTMKEGQPFNADYPDAFLARVRDMFDNLGSTKSEIQVDETRHTGDVTLRFAGSAPDSKKPGRRGGRGPYFISGTPTASSSHPPPQRTPPAPLPR
jgi:outer membrane protein insertion porin family